MELVPLTPEHTSPDQGTSTALVPLATTGLRRVGGELPPVCLALSSSTLIGLRVYLDEFCAAARATETDLDHGPDLFETRPLVHRLAGAGEGAGQLRRLDRTCLEAYRASSRSALCESPDEERLSHGGPPVSELAGAAPSGLGESGRLSSRGGVAVGSTPGGICRWRMRRRYWPRWNLILERRANNAPAMWRWPI